MHYIDRFYLLMMNDLTKLEEELLAPDQALIEDMRRLDGDIMLLGAGGKMGPSLAVLARKALTAAGKSNAVIGVSRFTDASARQSLEGAGVQTIAADLLDDAQREALPPVENIIYLVGTKFGTSGNESFTWAMNTYLPGRVAEQFRKSKIVAFSTGNVYPFVSVLSGGATEETPPEPIGEYAQSCLGRERMFEYFSKKYAIPTLIYRLNYAVDFRYGVLLEGSEISARGATDRPDHRACERHLAGRCQCVRTTFAAPLRHPAAFPEYYRTRNCFYSLGSGRIWQTV